jgi:hypothetical protein
MLFEPPLRPRSFNRDKPVHIYNSFHILHQCHFTFPIIPLYYTHRTYEYYPAEIKNDSIELILTVGSLHIVHFILHATLFQSVVHIILCAKRPLTEIPHRPFLSLVSLYPTKDPGPTFSCCGTMHSAAVPQRNHTALRGFGRTPNGPRSAILGQPKTSVCSPLNKCAPLFSAQFIV